MSYQVGDPVHDLLAAETQADHARAVQRGLRVLRLADRVVSELIGDAILAPALADDARVAMFDVLADDLYGMLAIDIPTLRGDR